MGGLTQVRVEDMDLEAGYLLIRASNAQWNKNHTVILLPPITIELRSYLTDNAINQGYFSRADPHEISASGRFIGARQIQIVPDSSAEKAGLQVIKHKDKVGVG